MDLQKRKLELIEEHKKAVNLIEQHTQKRLKIEGAILLIEEMEKSEDAQSAEGVEPKSPITKRTK